MRLAKTYVTFNSSTHKIILAVVLCDIIFTGISIISVLLSRYDNYHDNFMKNIHQKQQPVQLTHTSLFRPNKFVVLPEHGRGQSQFQQTTCFMFITASRLWRSHFFTTCSQLAAQCLCARRAHCLGGVGQGVVSICRYWSCTYRLSQHKFLSIYRIIDIIAQH